MSDWLWQLDLETLVAAYGADAVDRALGVARTYTAAPRLDGERISATAVFAESNGRLSLPLSLSARSVRGGTCSCVRCEHVLAMLVDLAVHAPLREALVVGDDSEPLLEPLADLRASALELRQLDTRIAEWLPAHAEEALEIDLEPRPGQTDGWPILLVRCRRHGERQPLPAKQLLAAPASRKERRWLDLTAAHHADRHALCATRGQAAVLLHTLRDDIGVRCQRFRAHVQFSRVAVHPRAEAEDERLQIRWYDANGTRVGDARELLLFSGPHAYLWSDATCTFYPLAEHVDLDAARGMQRIPSLPLAGAAAERVGRALLLRGKSLGVELPPPQAFGLPPLERPRFELRLTGSPLAVRGQLFANYRVGRANVLDVADATFRHVELERAALQQLDAQGLRLVDGVLQANEDDAVLLWREGVPELRAHGMLVWLSEALGDPKVGGDVQLDILLNGETGWLDAELTFRAEALTVEIRRLHDVLAEGHRWIALDDGTLCRIQDDLAELLGDLRLVPRPTAHLGRWLEARDEHVHVRWEGGARSVLDGWRSLGEAPEPRLPRHLRADLRAYQRVGVAWLQWLHHAHSGGILADDMGLGKTLTVLTFLAERYESGERRPSLVVCPTSLVGNWLSEAKRFTPQLRAATWVGPERGPVPRDVDVVITSYGLLRREPALGTDPYFAVVLDEAQMIKNPDAEVSRAARTLEAEMRVAVTGTPVENRLLELWSLFAFAQRDLLGARRDFEQRYEHVELGAALVRRVVRPFVLRRTKSAVLTELPPKVEVERPCFLDASQKRVYDALAIALRQTLRRREHKRERARARLSALTAILRLRQMACDPRLVDQALPAESSAKRAAFLDLVRELVASKRRALVFSQFVSLFDLWRRDLDDAHVRYEYLDGQTRERDAAVRRFQEGDATLFLISRKAGGFGLNLTAADTVIHCDPWWNPAVEDQAESRAHRMGQRGPVTVVRLVAHGTIEHKMKLLKEHKRELVASLWEGNMDRPYDLSDEDLELLLGDADENGA